MGYSSERVDHVGRRKLLSEGVVWEQCDFEKAHTPHAFLPLYIFLIFLLFVGKNMSSINFYISLLTTPLLATFC